MKKPELVFIPVQGLGHLLSAIEVAKLLAAQNEDLSITFLLMEGLNVRNQIADFPQHPQLRFNQLRKDDQSPETQTGKGSTSLYDYMNLHKNHVREIVSEITSSGKTSLAGVVVDMMCTCMIDVVNELGVPSYVFFPSCASFLGLMFHLQGLRDGASNFDVTEFKASGKEIAVPAYASPVPAAVLPSMFFDKEGGCDAFLDHAKRYRKTKGILINTFRDLETHALESLLEDESIPPVYPIGPVLKLDGFPDNQSGVVLNWLDLQPESSVLFLCFGSMGSIQRNQVSEIATALEKSGYRFLWSLRKPNLKNPFAPPENYEDMEEVLPEGFLQRTAEVGRVIGWAPQAAVLAHAAVGGFVTHCGWNSVLESAWNGVPVATWPFYAEQQVNAFLLVKDLGLAAEIKMDYRQNFGSVQDAEIVSADVIEKGIIEVMDSGNGLRKKMGGMKEKSKLAVSEGGSSHVSLTCFLNDVGINVVTSS